MNIRTNQPVLMGGWLTDTGNFLGKATRGIMDLASKARGDSEDVFVPGQAPVSMTNALVYGGLAALGLYMVVKK